MKNEGFRQRKGGGGRDRRRAGDTARRQFPAAGAEGRTPQPRLPAPPGWGSAGEQPPGGGHLPAADGGPRPDSTGPNERGAGASPPGPASPRLSGGIRGR